MWALSFLLLIGVLLVAEGLGQHIDRGYIYFAMGFSFFVKALNLRLRPAAEPVHLRGPSSPGLNCRRTNSRTSRDPLKGLRSAGR